MKLTKIKNAALYCVLATLIYSCANDDDVSTDTVAIIDNPIVVSNVTTQVVGDWNSLWLEIDRYNETAVSTMDGYTSN